MHIVRKIGAPAPLTIFPAYVYLVNSMWFIKGKLTMGVSPGQSLSWGLKRTTSQANLNQRKSSCVPWDTEEFEIFIAL